MIAGNTISSKLDIRPYQKGDRDHILKLFRDSFGRDLTPEFWDWRFLSHPAGGPLIMLAWDGDVLAGQYAASQAPIVVDGAVVPAALSMSTMTHPNYRGQGVLQLVAEALYDDLKAKGYAGVWGFPNAMINGTRQKKLAWAPIVDVPSLSVHTEVARPAQSDFAQVKPADWAALSDWLVPGRTANSIQGLRSADILSWRTDQNPVNDYTSFCVAGAGDDIGYVICKRYGDTALDLVDLQTSNADVAGLLIDRVIAHAQHEGIAQINTWSLPCDENRLVLERRGFHATAPVTYFGGRCFTSLAKEFNDPRNWRLSMLDSDLY